MGRRRSTAEHHLSRDNVTTLMSSDIPLFHILPKLPVKSLLRFSCVSKQWHSFITTPLFVTMQLHHATNEDDKNHHKLLVLSTTEPYKFRIIECENPQRDDLTANKAFPFPFEVGRHFRYKSIVTTFHGLVCVGIIKNWYVRDAEYSDLILWNPLTGEYKTLSKAHSHKECYDIYGGPFGLYYSSSDDDYKLIRVSHLSNVYIYSLKSDSWRKVKSTQAFRPINHYFSYDSKPSVLLNEKLYLLEQINITGNFTPPHLYSLIVFDIKAEKFTEIATPFSGNPTTDSLSFMVVSGCIHLFARGMGRAELWRMDGDGDWTKVETESGFSSYQKPLHLMRSGKWLMRSSYDNIYQVNMKKHNRRKLYSLKSSDIVIEERYVETLVSPNQYMK